MTAARSATGRWALHPLALALVLLVLVVAGAVGAGRGVAGAESLLACLAGFAAGFANSGST